MTIGDTVTDKPRTLADLRKAANLTSEEVAERMGVNGQRVRQIEATFPNLNYDTVSRYITAIGGSTQFVVGTHRVPASEIVPDPKKTGTRKYLKEREGRGGHLVWKTSGSRAAEELPLKRDAADTGSDDTSGQVDHADTQGDQGDSDQGQEA